MGDFIPLSKVKDTLLSTQLRKTILIQMRRLNQTEKGVMAAYVTNTSGKTGLKTRLGRSFIF